MVARNLGGHGIRFEGGIGFFLQYMINNKIYNFKLGGFTVYDKQQDI